MKRTLRRLLSLHYNAPSVVVGNRDLYVGRVYETTTALRMNCCPSRLKHWSEPVGELPRMQTPRTADELVTCCELWIEFFQDSLATELGDLPSIVQPLLERLYDTLRRLPDRPALSSELRTPANVDCENLHDVAELLRTYRDWAKPLVKKVTPRKQTGRRPKEETDSERTIIGALKKMLHERGLDDPPTGRQIVEVSGVANVSRFIRKEFKSQSLFEAAWRRGDVAGILAGLEYLPEGHAEYDETRPTTQGRRHRGRTPGSQHDDD